VKIWAR